MTTELQTQFLTYLKTIDNNNYVLNDPIEKKDKELFGELCITTPTDLLELLQISNGQKSNSHPIFIKLNGSTILKYKFLNAKEIKSLHKLIQDTTKDRIDKNLIPFAKYEKDIGDKGSMAFAISAIDNSIYHILFYEFDRFTTVHEHRSEKFSKSMLDFIESETEWVKFTSC